MPEEKRTHAATTSDIVAEIKPEMLEKLKAIGMPKEAYPQGKYGNHNYRISSEKGARIEVQLKQGLFRIVSSNVDAEGSPNTAWKLHGGVADAWRVVKERSGW